MESGTKTVSAASRISARGAGLSEEDVVAVLDGARRRTFDRRWARQVGEVLPSAIVGENVLVPAAVPVRGLDLSLGVGDPLAAMLRKAVRGGSRNRALVTMLVPGHKQYCENRELPGEAQATPGVLLLPTICLTVAERLRRQLYSTESDT